MEKWVPLFDIFLNSPCPETQASLWLQQSFNTTSSSSSSSSSSTTSISSSSFLSLLIKPTDAIVVDSSQPSSSPRTKKIMWIQTLPNVVQARVLTFLAYDYKRFCGKDLSRLAKSLLNDGGGIDFWVKRGAHQLLDMVSDSSYEWVSCFNLDSEGENVDDFGSLPDWLKEAADSDGDLVLPWHPMSSDELGMRMPVSECGVIDDSLSDGEGVEEGNLDKFGKGVGSFRSDNGPVDPEIEKMAAILKSQILDFEFTPITVELADGIRKLCNGREGYSLAVLGLIEPWKAEDEKASIMLTHLSDGSYEELGWPSHVLCSIVLPKLLVLEEPASRVLVTATIAYCKLHQRSAVYALLYPLILRKEGINNPISDVIARVIRECLHPAHVSAFCQKLLCGEEEARKLICLPCHQSLISDELVWNEPLFNLFQIILNHNFHLTEDSVNKLVSHIREMANSDKLGLSLELGPFAAGVMISTTDLAEHTLEQVGMSLAQIGEFAFVLRSRASNLKLVEGKLYLLLLGTTALSLVTTPLLFKLIPSVVHLGVLLRWFSPDTTNEIGYKGDMMRSESTKLMRSRALSLLV